MSDPILQNDTLSVNNDSNKTTIRRGKHDKEHPYIIISKKIFRDKSLSLDARGLLGYLLSLKDDWVTHPRQVAEEVGVGKTKIYSLLNELIAAGYATKENHVCAKRRFTGVTYYFYEEKLEKPQEIKKQSTVSAKPDTDLPDTETRTLMNNDSIDKTPNTLLKVPTGTEEREGIPPKKEKPKQKAESFSPEVLETSQMMIDAMRIIKEDYSAQNGKLLGILTEVDRMIRIDKRDPARIVDVFRWALCDSFWCDKMFKPNPAKYLREKFDQLEMKMRAEPQEALVAQKPKEQEKPTLTKRLQGRYKYKINFGNYEFTSSNGYYVGKIPINDPDALELWLKDKGL